MVASQVPANLIMCCPMSMSVRWSLESPVTKVPLPLQ